MQKEELERQVKTEVFDVKVQYCNPDQCWYDCELIGFNKCDAHISKYL